MTTETNLLPCPFCSGKSFLDNLSESGADRYSWYVRCTICEVQQIVNNDSRATAIALWNKRSGTKAESAATHEMSAERSGASPSSADLSRGSAAPSVIESVASAMFDGAHLQKWVVTSDHYRAEWRLLASAAIKAYDAILLSGFDTALDRAKATASQMAQSNDHARPEVAVDKAITKLVDAAFMAGRYSSVEIYQSDKADAEEELRALLASPSEPSGRGESGGHTPDDRSLSMNKEEQK